jgi:hypothetical protein
MRGDEFERRLHDRFHIPLYRSPPAAHPVFAQANI